MKISSTKFVAVMTLLVIFAAGSAQAQTISPPISEYRGKANGMFELRNDSDVPLAVILETNGFAVDENGGMRYIELDPTTKVELGSQSFVIPARQTHMVFYKATSSRQSAWFAILATLTNAHPDKSKMRINYVLPHVVYVYQKAKLKKDEVSVQFTLGSTPGKYILRVENHSEKLSRVQQVVLHGFDQATGLPAFPLFPGASRNFIFEAGPAGSDAAADVIFQDGFDKQVSLKTGAPVAPRSTNSR